MLACFPAAQYYTYIEEYVCLCGPTFILTAKEVQRVLFCSQKARPTCWSQCECVCVCVEWVEIGAMCLWCHVKDCRRTEPTRVYIESAWRRVASCWRWRRVNNRLVMVLRCDSERTERIYICAIVYMLCAVCNVGGMRGWRDRVTLFIWRQRHELCRNAMREWIT